MANNEKTPAHSQRYSDALGWAAELHRCQRRKEKEVPYLGPPEKAKSIAGQLVSAIKTR